MLRLSLKVYNDINILTFKLVTQYKFFLKKNLICISYYITFNIFLNYILLLHT